MKENMAMQWNIIKGIAVLIAFLSTSAYASNFTFLTDAPVSYFTNADWDYYTAAQNKALHAADGVKITWKNPQTGAWGSLTPSKTRKENGVLCRNIKIVNNAKGRTGEAVFKVCKLQNGWKAI